MTQQNDSTVASLGKSPEEVKILEARGEEIIGYAMSTIMDTFSKRSADRASKQYRRKQTKE